MNSPDSTSYSSWDQPEGQGVLTTEGTEMDRGSTPIQQTSMRGIDVLPLESNDALVRPAQINHPVFRSYKRLPLPSAPTAKSQ